MTMTTNTNNLTYAQRRMLECLRNTASGEWSKGGSFMWSTPSGTKRIFEALVRKGLCTVERDERYPDRDTFRLAGDANG